MLDAELANLLAARIGGLDAETLAGMIAMLETPARQAPGRYDD